MSSKTGKIIKWALIGIVSFIFIASGLFKLVGGEATSEMAKGVGGSSNLFILGSMELVIVALFLYNRTSVLGWLAMIAYIGGAMAVHFVNNQPMLVVVVIQILIWIAGFLRFEVLRERILKK